MPASTKKQETFQEKMSRIFNKISHQLFDYEWLHMEGIEPELQHCDDAKYTKVDREDINRCFVQLEQALIENEIKEKFAGLQQEAIACAHSLSHVYKFERAKWLSEAIKSLATLLGSQWYDKIKCHAELANSILGSSQQDAENYQLPYHYWNYHNTFNPHKSY